MKFLRGCCCINSSMFQQWLSVPTIVYTRSGYIEDTITEEYRRSSSLPAGRQIQNQFQEL